MSDPYIGEIRIVPYNFAPAGWADCDGSLLPISTYDTLYALIGTTYGGDGVTTFALPDLRGRAPMHFGQGPGLSARVQGQVLGSETVTLTTAQMPAHTHAVTGTTGARTLTTGAGNVLASGDIYGASAANVDMSTQTIGANGGSQPHENMQPFLTVRFIISLFGTFPTAA